MLTQFHKFSIDPAAETYGHAPAVAIVIKDAGVYVAFTNADELEAIAKALNAAARDLVIKQRKGKSELFIPEGVAVTKGQVRKNGKH